MNNDLAAMDFMIRCMETEQARKDFVNMQGVDGNTAAHVAGFMGYFDALNLLIENGADLNLRDESFNESVFDLIVQQDRVDLFKCVYRPKREIRTQSGVFGVIHQAAARPNSEILRLLLSIGVSPNEMCNEVDRAPPLLFACQGNHLTNVERLLKKGASLKAFDCEGQTAMHIAVEYYDKERKNLDLIKLLESNGANATV